MIDRFGLTACCSEKRGEDEPDRAFRAERLYDSSLFEKRVQALEAHCDQWAIFSGKHGYLDPDDKITWYDQKIGDLPKEERLELARDVVDQLPDGVDEVMILMGRKYADPLKEVLPDDVSVWDPLEGVRLFDQSGELEALADDTEQDRLISDGGQDAAFECFACEEPVPAAAEYCPYCASSLTHVEEVEPGAGRDDRDDQEESADDTDQEEASEYQQVHWSDESDEWATPPELLRPLDDAVGGFDLDPCSGAEARSIAPETYTEEDDGLARRWFGAVWCNPPYSDAADWIEKARNESRRDEVEVVLVLLPARTSTQWFQKFAATATALCFIEGRLRFGDAEDDAPFPSVLLAFGDVSGELYDFLQKRGVVFIDGERYSPTRQISLDAVATGGGESGE
jgi:phage N-6-adenine-methyltransferase